MSNEKKTREQLQLKIRDPEMNAWLDAQKNMTKSLEFIISTFQRKYGNIDVMQPRTQYAIEIDLGLEIDLAKSIREKNQLMQAIQQSQATYGVPTAEEGSDNIVGEEKTEEVIAKITEQTPPVGENRKQESGTGEGRTSTELTPEDLDFL